MALLSSSDAAYFAHEWKKKKGYKVSYTLAYKFDVLPNKISIRI